MLLCETQKLASTDYLIDRLRIFDSNAFIYANLALFISPVKTLGLFSCYCLLPVASRLLSIAYCLNHIACCPLPVAM